MQAMPYIKDIIGIGLARGIPNWKGGRASHTSFAPIFKQCKDMGLHLTAHAGMLTLFESHYTHCTFTYIYIYMTSVQMSLTSHAFLSMNSSFEQRSFQHLQMPVLSCIQADDFQAVPLTREPRPSYL